MLADFELNEINRLNSVIEQERARMRTLIEMLHQLGVEVWTNPDGVMVVNEALEAPYPAGDWPWVSTEIPETTPITLPRVILGPGYFGLGLGADGT